MRIGEVAAEAGVSVRAVRYYEQAGLLPARRRANGYREFDPSAVARVRAIRHLLDGGFTVEEIRALADCLQDAETTRCRTRTATAYRTKLTKLDAQIRTLQQLRGQLAERAAGLEPCW